MKNDWDIRRGWRGEKSSSVTAKCWFSTASNARPKRRKKLILILFHLFFDVPRLFIHHRINVGRLAVVFKIVPNRFVMYEPNAVLFLEIIKHLFEILAAAAFVAERPANDRRMIFVSFIKGGYPVHARLEPLLP